MIETWKDFVVPLVQEWEYSDAQKQKWVLGSLREPTIQIIQALKGTQLAATVQDYLTVLESIYRPLTLVKTCIIISTTPIKSLTNGCHVLSRY